MDKWEHYTMNSTEAYQHIKKAFFKIRNSSPIYSGDNFDMLMQLPTNRRKEFMKVRHNLSKKFLKEPYDKSIVIESFQRILKL